MPTVTPKEICDCYACRLSDLIDSVQNEMSPTEVIMVTFKVLDYHVTNDHLASMEVCGEC